MHGLLRVAAQCIGVALLTLGAVNGYFATVAETCTMGVADSLFAGFLNLPLYLAGFGLIIAWPLRRWAWLAMLPALPGFAYHFYWTALFAWHYLVQHGAVCDLVTGQMGEWDFDGREPIYLALWIVLSLIIITGMWWAIRRTRRMA
jgi:hypothetical protein